MGHRANYALRQSGQVTLGTSRWGALGIPDVLFDGFAAVADYVRSLQVEDVADLYDNTFCEGCLLVDADQQVVAFDGISDLLHESPLRQITITALRREWPGWGLYVAERGILDVGEHLGLGADDMRRLGSDGPLYHTVGDEQIVRPENPQYRGSAHTEVVVADAGRRTSYLSEHPASALLAHGPRMVGLLDAAPAATLAPGHLLHAVCEVDVPSHTVSLWQDVPAYRALDRVRSAWPGWEVEAADAQDAEAVSQHPSATYLPGPDAAAAVASFVQKTDPKRAAEMEARALASLAKLRRARVGRPRA